MKIINIEAFQYSELTPKAKNRVIDWLDDPPLEYEDEEGNLLYKYAIDQKDEEVSEHCNDNGYLFDRFGRIINALIVEGVTDD